MIAKVATCKYVIYVTKIPRSGVLISSMNFPKRTECQYLSSRQYSALNKDFQMDDVFVDPINKGMPLGDRKLGQKTV